MISPRWGFGDFCIAVVLQIYRSDGALYFPLPSLYKRHRSD